MSKKQPSRAERWAQAIAGCTAALDKLADACSDLESAVQELVDVQGEFEAWRDNLPENLANSALGEKLEAICDLDLDSVLNSVDVDAARGVIDEASGLDLPLGFGRD